MNIHPKNYQLMKAKLIAALIVVSFASCKKDYSEGPSPFYVGEMTRLDGFNPKSSYVPYNCCTCPCKVTSEYTQPNSTYWYYNIVDMNDTTLTHVANDQLKKY
jgi:hypothetical protein